ncbi:CDP-diacylglycerol--glycerol-3-phosphate 3-phosphatidyltransferase [Inquilinus sp. CAU 1745]|uniref:CDP-diacylglycerol--glycerol-3-phosphate 3-phosphatidyltransferase n=1 Tax=Inquilinus sp. CAU 1745 TaxID=3140369 RepID=UPI00325B0621
MLTSLPNLLTIARIICIPILVVLFFIDAAWSVWSACALFTVAAATDYLDGYLARRMSTTSPLGKLLDPIADKMLVAATLMLLLAFDHINGWAVIPALIILLREILISGLREFLAGMDAKGLPVSRLAKWKTGVQMTALAVLIVGPYGPAALPTVAIGEIGVWVAGLLTIVTGWAYFREGMRQALEESPPPAAKRESPPKTAAGASF